MRASRGEAGGGACLVGPRQLQGLPSWTSLRNSHSGDSAQAFCLGGDKSLDAATLRRGGTLSEAAPVRRTPAGCCHCRFYQQHLKRMLEHVPWTGTLAPAPGPTWRRLTLLADVLGAAPPALMGHPSGDSEWEEIASPLQQVLGPSSVLSSMTHLAPSVQVPPHICDFAGHPPVSPLGTQCSREHLRNTSGVRVPSRPSTLSLVNTCVTSSSDSLSQWVEQLCRTASWMQQLLCRSQPRAAICPRPPTSFLRPPPPLGVVSLFHCLLQPPSRHPSARPGPQQGAIPAVSGSMAKPRTVLLHTVPCPYFLGQLPAQSWVDTGAAGPRDTKS